MNPSELPTFDHERLSQPAPTHAPANTLQAASNLPPAPSPTAQTVNNLAPKRGGGKAFLVILLLLALGAAGAFGYLWWKERSSADTQASATPTPSISPVATITSGSYVFSSSGTQNATATFSVSASDAYRMQLGAAATNSQAFIYNNAILPTYFTLNVADGYLGSRAAGHHVGEVYTVDITDAMKKDDTTTAPFGGQAKAADKQAAYKKLQELITKKDASTLNYLAKDVFVPFSFDTATMAWSEPQLLDIGNGFTGYTALGLPVSGEKYAPTSYLLLTGTLKDATGADRTVIITGQLSLQDAFLTSLASKTSAEAIKQETTKKLAEIKTAGKLPEDTVKLQSELAKVYSTIRLKSATQ